MTIYHGLKCAIAKLKGTSKLRQKGTNMQRQFSLPRGDSFCFQL